MFWSSEQHLWIGGNEVNVAAWYTPCAECERVEANLNPFLRGRLAFSEIKWVFFSEFVTQNATCKLISWPVPDKISETNFEYLLCLCLWSSSWLHQSPRAWTLHGGEQKANKCCVRLSSKSPPVEKPLSENKSSSCSSYKSEWKREKKNPFTRSEYTWSVFLLKWRLEQNGEKLCINSLQTLTVVAFTAPFVRRVSKNTAIKVTFYFYFIFFKFIILSRKLHAFPARLIHTGTVI